MLQDFNEFVNLHRTSGENITHTKMAKNNGGKFCFEGSNYTVFLEKYINVLDNYEKPELHFVEKPNKVTYLFVDIDFDVENKKRQYVLKDVKKIITILNNIIRDTFLVSPHQLKSFVMEKNEPTKRANSNMYKDGFHIHYPELPMEEKFRYYVLHKLSAMIQKRELLKHIDIKNNLANVVDMSIIKNNGMLMYGSHKEGQQPYKLTHVLSLALKPEDIDVYNNTELVHLFSNQKYSNDCSIDTRGLEPDIEKEIDEIYELYQGKKKPEIKPEIKQEKQEIKPEIKQEELSVIDKKNIALAKDLVKILSKKRADNYTEWTHVGYTLYAISSTLYNEYVEFSKLSPKFNDKKITCEKIWQVAETYSKNYTIGSLKYFAKTDNLTEYYKILFKHYDELFGRAETMTHADIADVVFELYKDRFMCIDIEKNKWYEFQSNKHKWVIVQSAYPLMFLISDEVRVLLTSYCSIKMNESMSSMSGSDKDNSYTRYKKLMNACEKLGNETFRKHIVKACSYKFHEMFVNTKFQSKLDSNVSLIGFDNGIYDLKEKCFRAGLPTDFVSGCVNYDWKEYNEEHPTIKKIRKFFSEVYTEEDMREYILTFIASILRGIPDQKIHIWTGTGANGKSALIKLLSLTLGDYFGIAPITILTQKRGCSSNATPELADKAMVRALITNEAEHDDVIYMGRAKEISGCDAILARPLYGNPFYYEPKFTMIFTCNVLPDIPTSDDGTWRRLRVTPHESKFVEQNPSPNKNDKQFLIDETLKEEMKAEWGQALMWLVITKYYKIFEDGINGSKYRIREPEKIKQFTKKYQMKSDTIMKYISENIEITNKTSDNETLKDLYDNFKEWYKNDFNEKAPNKDVFTEHISKKLTIEKNKVIGVKISFNQE